MEKRILTSKYETGQISTNYIILRTLSKIYQNLFFYGYPSKVYKMYRFSTFPLPSLYDLHNIERITILRMNIKWLFNTS